MLHTAWSIVYTVLKCVGNVQKLAFPWYRQHKIDILGCLKRIMLFGQPHDYFNFTYFSVICCFTPNSGISSIPCWIKESPFTSKVNVNCLPRSEEHTSELQSRENLVCRLLLEKKK